MGARGPRRPSRPEVRRKARVPPPSQQRFRNPYGSRHPPPNPYRHPNPNPNQDTTYRHDQNRLDSPPPQRPPRPPVMSLDQALPTSRNSIRMDDSVQHSDLGSTKHNRRQRLRRGISTVDLKKARRYGMKEYGFKNRLKYTFQGKVLILDPQSNKAISCWNIDSNNNSTERVAGTSKTIPVMIHKLKEFESEDCLWLHNEAKQASLLETHKWTSHTVLVVDMSGSMRRDDVDGARCRSDAVWTCLARDFVRAKLEQHAETSRSNKINLRYEMVSVVLMTDQAQVVLACEPTDYVLYNKLVDLREWTTKRPQGHGYYKAALEQAEALFNINRSGSCALQLFFCSDGKPSDPNTAPLTAFMGTIASRFGRRLTVTCLGIAASKTAEDFLVLRKMVEEAQEYGAIAHFHSPTLLTAGSISKIVTGHVTSSLSLSVSELSEPGTGQRLFVRTDLIRERRSAAHTADTVTPDNVNWRIFSGRSGSHTVNVWKWNDNIKDLCRLIDPRCVGCRVTVVNLFESNDTTVTRVGQICAQCNACYLCHDCGRRRHFRHPDRQCHRLAEERRQGAIVSEFVPSFQVAWKRACFGEGAERVAFKFRFLCSNDGITPVGDTMVAKESRFEGHQQQDLTRHTHQYHLNFLRAQHLASHHAETWNVILQKMQDAAVNKSDRTRIRKYPRIRFVKPHIFELSDGKITHSVLVEELIQGGFRKFNTNCADGGPSKRFAMNPHHQKTPQHQERTSTLNERFVDLLLTPATSMSPPDTIQRGKLEIVQEEDDGDASDDEVIFMKTEKPVNNEFMKTEKPVDDDDDVVFLKVVMPETMLAGDAPLIPDIDFMHAFSHFTYVQSSYRHMVVDLQGNLSIHQDGSRDFILTDPAVHTARTCDPEYPGRTNRGKRGIQTFLKNHNCNGACRIFGLCS